MKNPLCVTKKHLINVIQTEQPVPHEYSLIRTLLARKFITRIFSKWKNSSSQLKKIIFVKEKRKHDREVSFQKFWVPPPDSDSSWLITFGQTLYNIVIFLENPSPDRKSISKFLSLTTRFRILMADFVLSNFIK